ncbi:hypothetical protein SH2C18_23780 [Clostridium sediminicola]|uniref:hypothetical protein n=1 Tax=Clostridium sediminicola TaxID=3114879 RepID=UPI0031F254E8
MTKLYPFNSQFDLPYFPGVLVEDNEGREIDREDHKFYNVFVNGDFIGRKILLAQNDNITDMSSYLTENNFSRFSTTVDGNNYYIIEPDSVMAKQMKKQLDVYLNIK